MQSGCCHRGILNIRRKFRANLDEWEAGERIEYQFQTGTLLLLIAAVVAMLTRRLKPPYSVGLVVPR